MPERDDAGGGWRKGEFVLWTDLLVFLEAMLVWLGLVAVVAALAAGSLTAQHVSPFQWIQRIAAMSKEPAFHYATSATLYLTMLFFFGRVARRVADDSLAARFRPIPATTAVLAVLSGMALAVLMPLLIAYLTQLHLIHLEATKSEMQIIPHSLATWLMAFAAIGLIAPLTEELYFRGILLGWLRKKMPVAAAVPVSALVFGLIHFSFLAHQGAGGWAITAIIVTVGVIAAVLALKTRSLWASFGVHAGYNSMLISLPLLQTLLR